nr:hypothetical protein [Myxococcota bacterium]
VAALVAQGHGGRTIVSCDDGRRWVHDVSTDPELDCRTVDCTHHAWSAKGLAYARGHWVATWGWGAPGALRRSTDAVAWETSLEGLVFGAVVATPTGFLALSGAPQRSRDDGATWTLVAQPPRRRHVRQAASAEHEGESRVLVLGDTYEDVQYGVLSRDEGDRWIELAEPPDACSMRGSIAHGAGVWVVVGGAGAACRSTDGGQTWTQTATLPEVRTDVVWSGSEFVAWRRGSGVFRSADGVDWTDTATDFTPDEVAATASGAFVSITDQYERQAFHRSDDGVHWEALPEGAFTRGHRIRFIAAGRVPLATCEDGAAAR